MLSALLLFLPETARNVVGTGSIEDHKWNQPLWTHFGDTGNGTEMAEFRVRIAKETIVKVNLALWQRLPMGISQLMYNLRGPSKSEVHWRLARFCAAKMHFSAFGSSHLSTQRDTVSKLAFHQLTNLQLTPSMSYKSG
jgi:hypothetical protein